MKKGFAWILAICILLSGIPVSALTTSNPEEFHTTLSWIGNTYNGRDRKYIPHDIETMYVTPEGDIFTNQYWEEGGNNFGQFDKDGNFVKAGGNSHGWGYEGGYAVAANSNYVYFAQNINHEADLQYDPVNHPTSQKRWPPLGYHWYGVTRRLRSDITQGAPFEGGMGYLSDSTLYESLLVVCEEEATQRDSYGNITYLAHDTAENVISGLYATDTELYISDQLNDRILVYDAETMVQKAEYPFTDPSHLVMDQNGVLWILQKDAKKIMPMNPSDGTISEGRIIDLGSAVPTHIAIDNQNRLMVSDISANERILLYGNLDSTPSLVSYRGVEGGVYSNNGGKPGEIGNERFYQVSAIGADASGNYYVNNAGPYEAWSGGTTFFESYTDEGELRFRLMGLEFLDTAKLDPMDPNVVYTKHERFVLDRTKPAGQQATYAATLIDPHRYPYDSRIHTDHMALLDVRYVQGHKYMLVTDYYGYSLSVYRFDEDEAGEIAIPCAFFYAGYNNQSYPPNRDFSKNQAYIWIDQNGDGQFDGDEYSYSDESKIYHFFGYGWFLAEDGTLYSGGTMAHQDNRILTFPLQRITEDGVPVWGFDNYTEERAPAPFDDNDNSSVRRMQYDLAEDVMYIAGYKVRPTLENTGVNVDPRDRDLGDTFIRVENWSEGAREAKYVADIEKADLVIESVYRTTPLGFSLAGDYIFIIDATFAAGGKVYIYDKETGAIADTIQYNKDEDYGDVGYMDIPNAVSASYRGDGKYDIFVEDDARAKILHYTWESIEPAYFYAVEADEVTGGTKTYGTYGYTDYAPSAVESTAPGSEILFRNKKLENAERITISSRYEGKVAVYVNDGSGEEQAATITLDGFPHDYRTISAALGETYSGVYDIRVEVLEGSPSISWFNFPEVKDPTQPIDASKPSCVGGNLGVRTDGPEEHPNCMGWVSKGTFLKYDNYNFDDPAEISMCIRGSGIQMAVYLDNTEGDPIAIIEGEDSNDWTTMTAKVTTEFYGVHDVILECISETGEMAIAWFSFSGTKETGLRASVNSTEMLWETGEVSVDIYRLSRVPEDKEISVIFAAYDAEGRLADYAAPEKITASEIVSGGKKTLTGTFDTEKIPEDGSIKAFIWNSIEVMEPIFEPLDLPIPEKPTEGSGDNLEEEAE